VGAGDETSDLFGTVGATRTTFRSSGPNAFLRTSRVARTGQRKLNGASDLRQGCGGRCACDPKPGSSPEKLKHSGRLFRLNANAHGAVAKNTATYASQLHKSFGWYDFIVTAESDVSFANNWRDTWKREDPA